MVAIVRKVTRFYICVALIAFSDSIILIMNIGNSSAWLITYGLLTPHPYASMLASEGCLQLSLSTISPILLILDVYCVLRIYQSDVLWWILKAKQCMTHLTVALDMRKAFHTINIHTQKSSTDHDSRNNVVVVDPHLHVCLEVSFHTLK